MFNNRLKSELERLKRGDFTDAEFQNLCHQQSEDDYESFCDGCDSYQRRLFGRCRTDDMRSCNDIKPQFQYTRPSYQRILIAFAVVSVCFWVLITVLAIGFRNGG